jgi:uncharacterized protein
MVERQAIESAARKIAMSFQPERIILFGSHARGDADERSDVDLLIVTTMTGSRRALMVAMDRSLRGCGFARDIVILTPEEFERDKYIPGTLARPAWIEGRTLYARQ